VKVPNRTLLLSPTGHYRLAGNVLNRLFYLVARISVVEPRVHGPVHALLNRTKVKKALAHAEQELRYVVICYAE